MSNTLKFGNGEWYGKEGTILAYNSENNNYKPLPFTFERDSVATRVNKQGLIETVGADQPRIDYLNDSNGALLLEPSRANLYTYSNDVSFWTKNNVTTTSDYAISPDGTQNAFRAQFTSSTGLLYITATGTTGTDNTLSVWAKSNNGSSNKFRFFANGNTTLSDDFIATDEWQRFEFTFNCTSVTAGLTGASDSATNDILFYGFQHEVGSYATSYIPTQGSAVTRLADFCNQTVPDGVIGQTEGTLYVDFNINTGQGIGGIIELINPSNTQSRVLLWDGTAVSNNINLVAFFSAKSASITLNNVSVGNHKAVLIYSNSFTKFFLDGVKIGEEISNNPYSDMNKIDFNHVSGGVNFQQKRIKDVKLYNIALTDQEAIALTQV